MRAKMSLRGMSCRNEATAFVTKTKQQQTLWWGFTVLIRGVYTILSRPQTSFLSLLNGFDRQ